MSKIDELLKNEKVKWKKLGEVCEIKTGKLNANAKVENGKYLFFTTAQEISYINEYAFEGESLLVAGNANIGDVKYYSGKFNAYQRVYVLQNFNTINAVFLMHFMKKNLKIYLQNKKKQSAMTYIVLKDLEEFEIPVPSLETQEKIVKILDKFTNYVTELQAELQARNKQYEYYRDMLLSEEYLKKISEKFIVYKEGYVVRTLTIGDIAKIKNGKDWKMLGKGNIPVYGSGGKMNVYVDEHSYNKPTVLIPRKGSIENIFYVDEPFWNVDTIYYTEIDETKIKPKYFYYFMKTIDLKALSTNSTRPSLTQSILSKIKINIPTLEIQNMVVEVLDKFQSLLSDTQGLLPEEIEQRQKQYEYYREKLLTFEDKSDSKPQAASRKITLRSYFATLKQACDIVGVCFTGVEWKKLGDIGTFENGKGMPKSLFKENGSVGAIHYGHIYTKYNLFVEKPIVKVTKESSVNLKKVNYGDLVIAKTSENVEDVMKTVAYLGNETAVTGGHAAIFKHNENPKYLSYVFNGANYLLRQKNKFARGVKVIELSTAEMEKIKIPLPSLEVQEYIVSILDKFDILVNDINEGLPKEIELRQKQYEYYRERLLNFPK